MNRGEFQSGALSGVYLLLVGDDVEVRGTIGQILRYCGALTQEAETTTAAWTILGETTPSAIVLTLQAPAEPSWAFLRRLRSLRPEQGGKIPIVGVGPATLAASTRAAGVDEYLDEPIDSWTLCEVMARLTH